MAVVGVGAHQVGEERRPGTVIPGDVVGGEQQHQLVGAHPCGGDPKWRVLGQVERLTKLALRQHFQPELAGLLGQAGQVVLGPVGPQVVVDHRIRVAVAAGLVRRAQHRVAQRDGIDRLGAAG